MCTRLRRNQMSVMKGTCSVGGGKVRFGPYTSESELCQRARRNSPRSRSPSSTLVGEGGAGAHDLVRMMREGQHAIWSASASQWYAEPKRLAALGLLDAERTPGRTHERTHYTLTDAGPRGAARVAGRAERVHAHPVRADRAPAGAPSTSTPRCSSARWRRCASRSRSPTRRSTAPRRSPRRATPPRARADHQPSPRAAHPRRARGVAGRGRGRAQGCSSPA